MCSLQGLGFGFRDPGFGNGIKLTVCGFWGLPLSVALAQCPLLSQCVDTGLPIELGRRLCSLACAGRASAQDCASYGGHLVWGLTLICYPDARFMRPYDLATSDEQTAERTRDTKALSDTEISEERNILVQL